MSVGPSRRRTPFPRALLTPCLIGAAVLLLALWLPSGVAEACDPSFTTTSFTFDPETAMSSWDLVGQCENGCCCGGCPYANGVHIWFDDVPCYSYWTCENHLTDYGQTCGRLCSGAYASNRTDVVVTGQLQCGGDPGGTEEVQLGVIHFDWTPEITSIDIAPGELPNRYDLSVGYHFPQSWQRTLELYAVDADGNETFDDYLCNTHLGLSGTCNQTVVLDPDAVEIKVVAQACDDPSAIVEERKNIQEPPADENPRGGMVPDDDTSDEPNSCPIPATNDDHVRLIQVPASSKFSCRNMTWPKGSGGM